MTKTKACEFCGDTFEARELSSRMGWSLYCKPCVKSRVWMSKLNKEKRLKEKYAQSTV